MGGGGDKLGLLSAVFLQGCQGFSHEDPEKDGKQEQRRGIRTQKDKALSVDLIFLGIQRLKDNSA